MKITMLSILFVLTALTARAQFKIGSIEVTSDVFKEYIFDCYSKPDTVSPGSSSMGWHSSQEEHERWEEKRDALIKGGTPIKKWNEAYNDSVFEHSEWRSWFTPAQNRKLRGKLLRVKKVEAHTYEYFTGYYLVPRTPSERDFVIWYAKH